MLLFSELVPGCGLCDSLKHTTGCAATEPLQLLCLLSLPAVCRKRSVLVDGVLGSCATDVAAGQLIQLLEAPLPHPISKQHKALVGIGRRSSTAGVQQQPQPWRQLQVLHLDEHLAVVVKPFGLHIYGRGTGHLKHWLSQAVPASSAGERLLLGTAADVPNLAIK
jgi:hypothetical protein